MTRVGWAQDISTQPVAAIDLLIILLRISLFTFLFLSRLLEHGSMLFRACAKKEAGRLGLRSEKWLQVPRT